MGEQIVYQYLLFVSVEYAQSFAGGLQMGDKLFSLNVKRLFGFAQALVYLYDMLRNLSKLIVREGGLYVHVYGFVLVGPFGKLAQVVDGAAQFGGEFVEDGYQQQ